MKGKIYNTENGWVIEYTDWKFSGGNPKQLGSYNRKLGIVSIPLHPEDVKLFEKLPEYVDSGSNVRFKKIKINPLGREVDPLNLGQNQSGCIWVGKLIPEVEDDRIIQKQHIVDIMKGDEELGLYNDNFDSALDSFKKTLNKKYNESREIKPEDIFNDEKREGVKRVIHQHKVLKSLSLVNPAHLQMTSNGHGEFPDGYKLTEKGIQYIIEQLNKE